MRERILDLGCGRRKHENAIGVDVDSRSDADVRCDLNGTPLPFQSDSFDGIICHSIIEHLDDVLTVMIELHRVAKAGAMIDIITPHFSALYSWDDPTHRHHFSSNSFDYFLPDSPMTSRGEGLYEVVTRRIVFGRGLVDPLVEAFANRFRHTYERRLAFILPAMDLHFTLRVIK